MQAVLLPGRTLGRIGAFCAGPVVAIFLSSNIVNLGNLGFNVLFSRWMGPVAFGQLATLLTLFLAGMGVLTALQLAVSQRVAADRDPALARGLACLARRSLALGLAALPVLVSSVLLLNLGPALGLDAPLLLPLLLLCLPFALPLALARGIATGRLDARRVILSAQVEMWLRLVLSALAWHSGLGLAGVTAAISLSVLAGLMPLWSLLHARSAAAPAQGLFLAALPFAALQAGQVILMDGDVLIAQALLGAEAAGQVAALGLFQRIQFFGCFSLAVVLLPAVTAERARGGRPLRSAAPVFALYAAVMIPVIAAAFFRPEQVVTLLTGPAFLPAAGFLPLVSLSAAAFTLSFLLATYLAAIGDRFGIWAVFAACPVQLVAMTLAAESLPAALTAKLACQVALAALLLARAASRSLSPALSGASLVPKP
jgi:O-antigen/teichoic acid export membrane protein